MCLRALGSRIAARAVKKRNAFLYQEGLAANLPSMAQSDDRAGGAITRRTLGGQGDEMSEPAQQRVGPVGAGVRADRSE